MKQVNEENIKRDAQRILRALKYLKPLTFEISFKVNEQLDNIYDATQQILGEIGAAYTIESSRQIKSDFDEYGNWVDDEKPVKKEDMHGTFRRLSEDEKNELRPQVQEELDKWMSKKHFGLDKEVYDETVEYIISLFGEENYAPRNVKEAVSSWYNDTLDSFPEMLQGKGDKRKIASTAYLKQIKSSHCIKLSKKPIKSSTYQFVAEFDGQYNPRVIDYMFKNGSPSWIDLNEDWSNGKMFTEQELPKVAKQLEKYYAENGQGGASDIEIVKDDGNSVYLEDFLTAGSFDKAWNQVEDDWLNDTMTK